MKPKYETKTVKFPQWGLMGVTDLEKKLDPYIADGWEVVTEDRRKYLTGGKHSFLLRREK
ncbi:hypothetical protein [Plantibacter sp. YIM 135249]|uniref:hypothetical protein n=1 Tax=Plantibacter sp. YIM 135249 TaxID=3423918 RepID=UPI003D358F33